MSIIHHKLQTGVHRFSDLHKIVQHWEVLLELFKKTTTLKPHLTDKGADDAPIKYLVAVEKGLRSRVRQGQICDGDVCDGQSDRMAFRQT